MNYLARANDRTNRLIRDHKITSYIIAGSLLASVAFVSASAIITKAQIVKDGQEVPAVSIPHASPDPEQNNQDSQTSQNGQTTESAGQVAGTSTAVASAGATNLANTAPANTTSAPAASTPVTPNLPPAQQPIPAPANETPAAPSEEPAEEPAGNHEETPTDPQPAAGFAVIFDNAPFTTEEGVDYYTSTYNSHTYNGDFTINSAVALLSFKIQYDEGVTPQPIYEVSEDGTFRCEVSTKAGEGHLIGSVRLYAASGTPDRTYGCEFAITDGSRNFSGVLVAELVGGTFYPVQGL